MKQVLLLLITSMLLWQTVSAQTDTHAGLPAVMKGMDSLLFERGFNNCDTQALNNLVSEDFEFYHDKGGTFLSKAAFIESISNGICKLPYRARRELVANSLELYPLERKGELYGAIQKGVHRFYALEPGKPEYLTGTAQFTNLWLLEDGHWRLSRCLSYDHQVPGNK